MPEALIIALADTIPPAPSNLSEVGCVPVPPCAVCGAAACDHEREFPADPTGAPRVAVEAVRGPDGVYRGACGEES